MELTSDKPSTNGGEEKTQPPKNGGKVVDDEVVMALPNEEQETDEEDQDDEEMKEKAETPTLPPAILAALKQIGTYGTLDYVMMENKVLRETLRNENETVRRRFVEMDEAINDLKLEVYILRKIRSKLEEELISALAASPPPPPLQSVAASAPKPKAAESAAAAPPNPDGTPTAVRLDTMLRLLRSRATDAQSVKQVNYIVLKLQPLVSLLDTSKLSGTALTLLGDTLTALQANNNTAADSMLTVLLTSHYDEFGANVALGLDRLLSASAQFGLYNAYTQ